MYKILIADDEELIRTLIAKYAKFEGYETEEARDGMEAVRKCAEENFDIVIMDIMMPELDGFSAVREIRKKSDVPVIMLSARGEVNAETVLAAGVSKLQSLGMTFRKAEYITDFAEKVHTGAFDLEGIWQKSDEEAVRELSSLKGIGVWTAEMILLFCMQRQDVLSCDDLAIQRGLRMVYHHRKIDRGLFEKYRRRFSPYGSVASLYLWAVSGGAIPELHDYAPKEKK